MTQDGHLAGSGRIMVMGTTIPIKNSDDLSRIKEYYSSVKIKPRNYLLIVFGMNTALRISDILNIKWEDIYDSISKRYRYHVSLTEHKTGKKNTVFLNSSVKNALEKYRASFIKTPDGYLFKSNKGCNRPISRQQAYRIIKEAAAYAGYNNGISCHSLRKTFGYCALKKGISPAVIMKIYNHSSFKVTQRYLGIDQDEKDEAYKILNL